MEPKKIYILRVGYRDNEDAGHKDETVLCAFNTEQELIVYVREYVREMFETVASEFYVRMPENGAFGIGRKIYFAHDYCRSIERYFIYEVCELK